MSIPQSAALTAPFTQGSLGRRKRQKKTLKFEDVNVITEKVKQYIEANMLCRENLFYDWEHFLELLFAESGKVESILWFEHTQPERVCDNKYGA